jgi:hypothetical protein
MGSLALDKGANELCFCRLYPSSLQQQRQCLAPTCHLSALNLHCIAGAGLPIHMIGDFVGAKKKTSMGLLVINPLLAYNPDIFMCVLLQLLLLKMHI